MSVVVIFKDSYEDELIVTKPALEMRSLSLPSILNDKALLARVPPGSAAIIKSFPFCSTEE